MVGCLEILLVFFPDAGNGQKVDSYRCMTYGCCSADARTGYIMVFCRQTLLVENIIARNDVFDQQGLTAENHYIASTGIGGATSVRHASVAIDFLTVPGIREEDKQYLQAPNHLNPTHEYGVAFERGTSLSLPQKKQYFISGTASIDKDGAVVYEGDIVRQTGRLLENIGALLKDGDAMMNDIQYFIIYLRDISDYYTVEQLMNQFYPQIPHITVEARVCRPGWLIEMECIAEKQEQK